MTVQATGEMLRRAARNAAKDKTVRAIVITQNSRGDVFVQEHLNDREDTDQWRKSGGRTRARALQQLVDSLERTKTGLLRDIADAKSGMSGAKALRLLELARRKPQRATVAVT